MKSKIHRTKERIKQTGEVFTPPKLVNEILDNLPEDIFKDPTKTFIDPACGDGNFLVEVVKRKLAYGSTPEQTAKTTFGVDIMEDNIEHCKHRLIELLGDSPEVNRWINTNIVCANALEYDFSFEEHSSKTKTTNILDFIDF